MKRLIAAMGVFYLAEERRNQHSVTLEERERVRILGVTEVISFDEEGVWMETVDGPLWIKGSGLHVAKLNLDDGEVKLDGEINGMEYGQERGEQRISFFHRLLK